MIKLIYEKGFSKIARITNKLKYCQQFLCLEIYFTESVCLTNKFHKKTHLLNMERAEIVFLLVEVNVLFL